MKKIISSFILICFFAFNAHAASILENKITRIPEGGALKADFVQERHLTGIPKPIISTGEIVVWKDKGLLWNTKTPFSSMLLVSAKGLFQIDKGKKTPIVQAGQSSGDRTIFNTLGNVFAGDFSEGVQGFEIKMLPESQNQWHIHLSPVYTEIRNFIRAIDITGSTYISEVKISRPNGDHDVIRVKNHMLFDQEDIDKALSVEERGFF